MQLGAEIGQLQESVSETEKQLKRRGSAATTDDPAVDEDETDQPVCDDAGEDDEPLAVKLDRLKLELRELTETKQVAANVCTAYRKMTTHISSNTTLYGSLTTDGMITCS